ncbi:hypothetical protein J6590_030167 [Homalodisca vitripennis]|nr:hypothetical protein J6590_030167 [Homalodisca vitripennis]
MLVNVYIEGTESPCRVRTAVNLSSRSAPSSKVQEEGRSSYLYPAKSRGALIASDGHRSPVTGRSSRCRLFYKFE